MLIAVLMIFVIFSYTGLGVLHISQLSQETAAETVQNVKIQYALESTVNEALWTINNGPDTLVNVQSDGLTLQWEPISMVLSVNVDMFEMENEVMLDLSDDMHFDHAIAAAETIEDNGYTPVTDDDRTVKSGFDFLPDVDLDYFLDNAVVVSNKPSKPKKKGKHSQAEELVLEDGIHVYTGNNITIEDVRLNSGTLVFTGKNIRFRGDNFIHAPEADSTGAMPALIFTDPRQDFEMYSDTEAETIIGAIYCAGSIELHNGNLSGPVLANSVYLGDDIHFLDNENPDFYQWNDGFGAQSDYDFPKQVKRWKKKKWGKKAHLNNDLN